MNTEYLVPAFGACEKCGLSFSSTHTLQEVSSTCKNCGKKYKMCIKCQKDGCPACGGKLENEMEWATKNNVLF